MEEGEGSLAREASLQAWIDLPGVPADGQRS